MSMKKNIKKRMIYSLVTGVFITLAFICVSAVGAYSNEVVKSISQKTMRIQVIADSDSEYDQAMKMLVKRAVTDKVKKICKSCTDKNQYFKAVSENSEEIEKTAKAACDNVNYNKDIKVTVGTMYFPKKANEKYVFPAGNYDALRVEIGKAKGHNWWNLLYPPEFDNNEKCSCKDILDNSEYSLVTCEKYKTSKVKIRFAIVDWWQEKKSNKK